MFKHACPGHTYQWVGSLYFREKGVVAWPHPIEPFGCSLSKNILPGSKVEVHLTFDTAFQRISNPIGDRCERICCHKCCCMWPINTCDLIWASVCVIDSMTFDGWEVIKISMNSYFFCGTGSQGHFLLPQKWAAQPPPPPPPPPQFLWFISRLSAVVCISMVCM